MANKNRGEWFTSVKQVLVLVRKPPVGGKDSLEAFRVSVGLWAGDTTPEVLLLGDGVYNALVKTAPAAAKRPVASRFLAELDLCDIVPLAVREDLADRGIREDDLVAGVRLVSRMEAGELIQRHETVVAF